MVTGSGSPERPYEIATVAGGNPLDSLAVSDTATLDMTMVGAGTPTDKRRISGVVTARIRDLIDVSRTDVPVTGDVIQWNGVEWVFASPGATAVPVSGTWGTPPLDKYGSDSLIGQPIYLDSNGQIRNRPAVLAPAVFGSAVLAASYPPGVSLMALASTDTTAGSGWPQTGVGAIVETLRTGVANATQWFSRTVTSGQQMMFQRSGSDAAWGPWAWVGGVAPHYASYKATVQTMAAANTFYTVTFDSVDVNEGSPAITYAAGTFTLPIAGKYQLNVTVQHQAITTTSTVTHGLLKNGAAYGDLSWANTGTNRSFSWSRMVRAAAGDTLSIRAKCSTANANAYGISGARYTYADITLVGG